MSLTKTSKVLVLCGGDSTEREVSLRSGTAIYTTLKDAGYNVNMLDIKKKIFKR